MYTGKRAITLGLAAIIMASPMAVIGEEVETAEEIMVDMENEEVKGEYISFSGKIKELIEDEGKMSIWVEGMNQELIFHIGEDVLVTNMDKNLEDKKSELKEDMEIIAFYGKNTPMTMSIPGQLTPEVIVIKDNDSLTAKVDEFDEELVSSDNTLKLNLENVDKYANKKLLVMYGISTKSIPAQTSPEIIMELGEVELEVEEPEEDEGTEEINVLDKIKIDNKVIKMNMYRDSQDVLMVPVRDLTESLGYELIWNGKEKPMEITKGAQWTKITLDKNSYSFAKMAEFKLESAPILKDSTTYVPVSFIEEVLRVENFEIVDGMIEIEQK